MPRRRRNRAGYGGQIVNDAAFITNRLSWWGALLFGVFMFVLLHWVVPSFIGVSEQQAANSELLASVNNALAVRTRWLHWAAWACLLLGIGFALWKLIFSSQAASRVTSRTEKLSAWLAKLVGRFID